ncbi:MAG: hypothetical protein IJ222_05335 [Bacteroidales bacterium]|nr:hypothetical protein [Bacteroidales bacterium]
METLIHFIEKVENRVLYYVTEYAEHQDTMSFDTQIWVHQFSGKVVFDDYPKRDGYKLTYVYKLCDLDKNLRRIPDKRAIKHWVENEVLMHK